MNDSNNETTLIQYIFVYIEESTNLSQCLRISFWYINYTIGISVLVLTLKKNIYKNCIFSLFTLYIVIG